MVDTPISSWNLGALVLLMRYDAAYEQIGQQAEAAETPAVRAWMRKYLSNSCESLLLHIVSAITSQGDRDTNFSWIHESDGRLLPVLSLYFCNCAATATDTNSISSITKFGMAATSPTGLGPRCYRGVKVECH